MVFKTVSSAAISMMFGPSVFAALVVAGMSLSRDVVEFNYGLPDAAAAGTTDAYAYVPGLNDLWNPNTIASRLSFDVSDIDSTVNGWGNDETSYVCRVDPVTGLAAGDDGTVAGITFNELGMLDVLAQLRGGSPVGVFPFHLPPDAVVEDGEDDGIDEPLVSEVADDSSTEDMLLGFTFDPAFNKVDDQEDEESPDLLFEGLEISRVSDTSGGLPTGPGFLFKLVDTGFRFGGLPPAGPGGRGAPFTPGGVFGPRGFDGFGPSGGDGPGGFGGGGAGGTPTLLTSVIPPELDTTPISFTADEDGIEGGLDSEAGGSSAKGGAGGAGATAVPEPWTAPLFGFAALAALISSRRRSSAKRV